MFKTNPNLHLRELVLFCCTVLPAPCRSRTGLHGVTVSPPPNAYSSWGLNLCQLFTCSVERVRIKSVVHQLLMAYSQYVVVVVVLHAFFFTPCPPSISLLRWKSRKYISVGYVTYLAPHTNKTARARAQEHTQTLVNSKPMSLLLLLMDSVSNYRRDLEAVGL